MSSSSVLGEIVERPKAKTPGLGSSFDFKTNVRSGFPVAQHRSQSQSTFARTRSQQSNSQGSTRVTSVPVVASGPKDIQKPKSSSTVLGVPQSEDEWKRQMEEQNAAMIAQMSEGEIAQEQQDIIERYGSDLIDKLAKLREKRTNAPKATQDTMKPPLIPNLPAANLSRPISPSAASPSSPRAGILSIPGTPKKRTGKLRFSEGPDQVFVYESQPPSPRRVLGLLAPPNEVAKTAGSSTSAEKIPVVPAVKFLLQTPTPPPIPTNEASEDIRMASPEKKDSGDLEELSTDAIRKRFFPSESKENPALEWTQPIQSTPMSQVTDLPLRYDLKGIPIPPSKIQSLPSHLGLHHHAASDQAGYTLDDLLLLCRSTMAAQRSAMLSVLSKLLRRLKEPKEVNSRENVNDIRKKAVIVGLEAFGERSPGASSSVRLRGLDVLWEGVVGWKTVSKEQASELLSVLPIAYLLPAVEYNLSKSSGLLSSGAMVQVLEILRSLVEMPQNSPDIAAAIVLSEPQDIVPVGLLDTIVKGVLSSPRFGEESSMNLDAGTVTSATNGQFVIDEAIIALIELLQACTKRSRSCALGVKQATDALLRYLVVLPSSWPPLSSLDDNSSSTQVQIGISIITELINLYVLLGQYGIYVGGLATLGRDSFQTLSKYLIDNSSSPSSKSLLNGLRSSYLRLIETWIVCATDPHSTTPEHDILWSQVVGWELWAEALLFGKDDPYVWGALTAWIEGSSFNGVAGGKEELDKVEEELQDGWFGDNTTLLWRLQDALQRISDSSGSDTDLIIASYGIRLLGTLGAHRARWLELVSSDELKELIEAIIAQNDNLTKIPWEKKRIWTLVLGLALVLLKNSAHNSPQDYCRLASKSLRVILPGDESIADSAITSILEHLTEKPAGGLPNNIWSTTSGTPPHILKPFYRYALWPSADTYYIGPSIATPRSIKVTTTLIFDEHSEQKTTTPSGGLIGLRLPLVHDDWAFVPLDILLRSGNSEGRFIRSLPADWDADETEVVGAVLAFVYILGKAGVSDLCMEEVTFGCMKVYMLEHGQGGAEGKEVFTDDVVEMLLAQLLAPYRYSTLSQDTTLTKRSNETLEKIAERFLGNSQPFYQFYSDFLGLYDSISFADPLFGSLLLPATSLRYPRDFRRLFWGDYPWIIRALDAAVPIEKVLLNTRLQLNDWLWTPTSGSEEPILEDGEMLGYYLKALLTLGGAAEGFLSFVATHHIASSIWPDLRKESEKATKLEKTAVNLLRALLANTGGEDGQGLLQKVFRYQQNQSLADFEAKVSPECYQVGDDIAKKRLEWAVDAIGEKVKSRLILTTS